MSKIAVKYTTTKEQKGVFQRKGRLFFIFMILVPGFFFLVLELALRALDYGGTVALFIDAPYGYEQYYRCNPNVARRYFTVQSVIPTPPHQLFLKKKLVNGYRIFVLGESSAAGFPYSANASFPNVLYRFLSATFPEKYFEVVNLSLSAINSYTLADFMDEILEQSPDLILIYTGHNEYYGALGVGSSQSLGPIRPVIRVFLSLNKYRTFLFLRDCVGWIRINISRIFYKGSVVDPTATLMEHIVAEQVIPRNSTLYELGKRQFYENLDRIIEKALSRNIPVLVGELVSNIRDQAPFISVEADSDQSAAELYRRARECEARNDYDSARVLYYRAKDADALRFRAPEEFNDIIHTLCSHYNIGVVPLKRVFEQHSPHKLIGNTLMHEHLHPTKEGYYLIARAFYDAMKERGCISREWRTISFDTVWREGVTPLDSVYAELVVRHLKESWPFQPKGVPNRFADIFHPKDSLEAFAFRILPNDDYNLEAARLELGKEYEKRGEYEKALAEYRALIASLPQEIEFYNRAATVLLLQKKYNEARELLTRSLTYKTNPFAYKWIGQIALINGNTSVAIENLTKANTWDPQVVFNLSRAYYTVGNIHEAESYYKRLELIAPRSEYLAYLQQLRITTKLKQQKF
ncbi:MAG: GDSL-type esterase/lipase family protein [Bacteroidetes bacterium]|nr:GDSL-type esterase/lipase family protein [Bacteroidota bacterium]